MPGRGLLRAAVVCLAALVAVPVANAQAPDRGSFEAEALSEHVDFAIARGVRYLYSRQLPTGEFDSGIGDDQKAGPTAIALLALVSAGEPTTREEIRRGFDWLSKQKITSTYSLALRAAALSSLAGADRNPVLRRDTEALIDWQIDRGSHRGLYTYQRVLGEFAMGDLSNSQYGVLGVWYAAEAGVEVPRAYWQRVEDAWTASQCLDGGFNYRPTIGEGAENTGSRGSLTAAGAATLAITHDFLHAAGAGGGKGRSSKSLAAQQRAVAWLGRYFAVDFNPGLDRPLDTADLAPLRFRNLRDVGGGSYVNYMLYAYERVGEATGLTFFGKHSWYDEGARALIVTQGPDGSWNGEPFPGVVDTAYALLFLSRGRSPVVLQKLQWGDPLAKTQPWNNRTRDAASIVRWVRKQTERHVNWQITRLDYPAWRLRESPILYAASDKPLALSATERAALKTYLDQGGLLLAADEGKGEFAGSVEAMLAEMYPALVARELPKDHPFFTANFRTEDLEVPVRAVSNGVRELAVLLPEGDFSWRWQRTLGTPGKRSADFAIVGNALVQITGRSSFRNKGQSSFVDRDPAVADSATRYAVARLVYGGNWNPEPLAWEAFANRLHNDGAAELTTTEVSLTDTALSAETFPLAHLTATHGVLLSAAEVAGLARYLKQGGTLLMDVAGGADGAVSESFEKLLRQAVPELRFDALPVDHPVYDGALGKTGGIGYRPAAIPIVGGRVATPRLRGGFLGKRLAVVLSAEDLTTGLLNLPNDGLIGYTPEAARQLVTNVMKLSVGK